MSELTFIATDKAPAAVGPYSQAVAAGGMLYVSGQLGLDPATMTLAEGFTAQAEQAMRNLGAILDEAGCAVTDIVSVDVFLVDMDEFKTLNGIYAEFMGEHKPARAAIQVAALPLGGLVEIKCVVRCS
ncbi:RidA family protein [Pseudodesulfovibrio sediminis]|uniref:Reactive intermediate/imine deaminase n=1 Tax=Pseudodesulfovibrio sediminis TaxID=2810563 RepID=A0ABN6EWN1_9BACT|nr:RidA family protein [Pseudodesulfovibrio sediminis]BCS89852.1 reactive intermediate/imine deaminase [Pseudodesulfovibrio sediminis]